jgi:integrase
MARLGRALGPGRLYRRTDSRGQASWFLDYRDGAGRRRREMLGRDKRIAERRRAELIHQRDLVLAGLGSIEGQARPLTELRDLYLEDLRLRVTPHHLINVEDRLDRALRELRCERVRDLIPHTAMNFRSRLVAGGLSHRTANLHVDTVSSMLRWGVQAGLIAQNPLEHLKRLPEGPKHVRCRRRAMTDEEIEGFLAAAQADDRHQAVRLAAETTIASGTQGRRYAKRSRPTRVPQAPLWRAFVESGARYGELTALTWDDVDLDESVLTLRAEITKAGRERQIPLLDELAAALEGLLPIHESVLGRPAGPTDRVFLTPEGAPWGRPTNNLGRIYRRLLAVAAIPRVDAQGRKLDVHALRHTAATRMARAGVGLAHAQRLLGHSDPKLTARVYTHANVEDLRAALEAAMSGANSRAARIVRAS